MNTLVKIADFSNPFRISPPGGVSWCGQAASPV